jgi:hypothetical protein
MAHIAIVTALTALAVGCIAQGLEWYKQGIPVDTGWTIRGWPAKFAGFVLATTGVVLAVGGWIWGPIHRRW